MVLEAVILGASVLFLAYYFSKVIWHHVLVVYYAQKLPGPPKYNLCFGNMRPLQDTPDKIFQVLRKWGVEYYPIYKLWIGPISAVNLVNPEDIALVLSDIRHNKKSIVYNAIRRWLANGILLSTGDYWQKRRKMLTPAFHFNILQDFIRTFNERTEELVQTLKKKTNEPYVKVDDLITHFSLKIIAETAMGKKVEFQTEKEKSYKKALHDLVKIGVHRTFRSYLLYDWIYIFSPWFYREKKLLKTLHDFTEEVINEREKNFYFRSDKRLAMLDLLLSAKNQHGTIDFNGIREEVDTITFGGHDTTSAAMTFGLILIACHPKIQEEIVQEMREVLGDIKKKPNYQELQELKYMERCIKETLRMYPSVPYISRELGEDIVTHTGYKVKKGTVVQIHIYDLHHNAQIYPEPEKFDPDRFLPENCETRHAFAYLPFSAGPRNCLGQKFSMLEMKAILCGILGNFVLEPVDTPESIVLKVDIVLRATDSIRVKFVPRNDKESTMSSRSL